MNKVFITDSAKNRIKEIFLNNKNKYFRIYIFGGGCNGFIYRFKLDYFIKNNDIFIYKNIVISDYISFNYINNSIIDYKIEIMKSYFYIKNPNVKSICNCGKSFSI